MVSLERALAMARRVATRMFNWSISLTEAAPKAKAAAIVRISSERASRLTRGEGFRVARTGDDGPRPEDHRSRHNRPRQGAPPHLVHPGDPGIATAPEPFLIFEGILEPF